MYIQPLAIRLQLGLEYRLWMSWMIVKYQRMGITTWPVFRQWKRRATDKLEQAK